MDVTVATCVLVNKEIYVITKTDVMKTRVSIAIFSMVVESEASAEVGKNRHIKAKKIVTNNII